MTDFDICIYDADVCPFLVFECIPNVMDMLKGNKAFSAVMKHLYQAVFIWSGKELLKEETTCVYMCCTSVHLSFCMLFAEDAVVYMCSCVWSLPHSNRVLRMSDDMSLGKINWDLAVCLLLAWIMCYFCIFKGIKSSGKAGTPFAYIHIHIQYLILRLHIYDFFNSSSFLSIYLHSYVIGIDVMKENRWLIFIQSHQCTWGYNP